MEPLALPFSLRPGAAMNPRKRPASEGVRCFRFRVLGFGSSALRII